MHLAMLQVSAILPLNGDIGAMTLILWQALTYVSMVDTHLRKCIFQPWWLLLVGIDCVVVENVEHLEHLLDPTIHYFVR